MNKKLKQIFASSLGIDESLVHDGLKYAEIPQWDSVAHMGLVSNIENEFEIMMDTDDVIGMSSFAVAREIVGKYGVKFDA
ncbi:MAG: acyl carrier protein [Planctomycetaceae bacterium]